MNKLKYLISCSFLFVTFGIAHVYAQYQYPFQDPGLPIEERVNNIISLMTLDEKIACLGTRPNVPRLGITGTGHVEGLHGLAMGGPGGWGDQSIVPTTQFPQAIGMAETWDTDVIHQAGEVEGYEVRICSNPASTKGAGLSFARQMPTWDEILAGEEPKSVTAKIRFSTEQWPLLLLKDYKAIIRNTGRQRRY